LNCVNAILLQNVLGVTNLLSSILGVGEEEYLDSKEGSWPWQAMLTLDGLMKQSYKQLCQGTIISDTYVMTASHCVEKYERYSVQCD